MVAGADARLSHAVIAYWTSLAAAGDPIRWDDLFGPFLGPMAAPEDRPYWPSFAQPADSVLSLAAPISVESDFAAKHHCALWASLGYPEVLISSVPKP